MMLDFNLNNGITNDNYIGIPDLPFGFMAVNREQNCVWVFDRL